MAFLRKTCLALGVVALLTVAVAQTARQSGQMERRRQELKLELLRERARIIRDDPDAAVLREKIEKLQLELGRLVDAKPAVQRLKAELTAVEKVLKRQQGDR